MKINKGFNHKFFSLLSLFSLIVQLLLPFGYVSFLFVPSVSAEEDPALVEVVPADTTTTTVDTQVLVDPVPEPSPVTEVTPAPEPVVEPTAVPAPEPVTLTEPVVELVPTTEPTVAPTPEVQSPQAPAPTVSVENDLSPPVELSATVLDNTSASSVMSLLDEATVTSQSSATLVTDKADYAPTDSVLITGTGFTPDTSYTIYITTPTGDFSFSDTLNSDSLGNIIYTYQLDGTYRPDYVVEIKSGDALIARVTFTDAPQPPTANIVDYSQCSNDDGDGFGGDPGTCGWTNGNLQSNNSTYFEHDATVQRLHINNLTPGSHTVLIQYGTTKGGKHSYDFLTEDLHSEDWVTASDLCSGLTGFAACSGLTPTGDAFPIPEDPNAHPFDDPYPDRHFSIRNGTITAVGVPTLTSGTYAGDSDTSILVSFSVDASCANKEVVQGYDTCPVLLTWGAHVSSQEDWGDGNSAVNIPGSPYHVATEQLDGSSIGRRDNQMQAGAIVVPVQATLTLLKTVVNDNGGTALDTAWTLSADGPTPISGVEGNAAVTNALVDAGTYNLSESAGPSGYTAGTYSCVVNGGAPVVGNSVTLAPEDNAVCTITNNDIPPVLHLRKVVVNNNGGSATVADFTLTANGTGSNDISGTSPVDSGATLQAGTFALSETSPGGYTASSWACVGGTQNGSNITLGLGQEATCTITNTDVAPQLIVIKHVINDNGGIAVAGDFTMNVTANNPSDASFPGVESPGTTITVGSGAYSVDESAFAGYSKSLSADCSGTIAVGQTKTCTITNDDIAPKLTLVKVVVNDDGGNKLISDFPLFISGTPATSGVSYDQTANVLLTASETTQTGYTPSSWGGDCAANGTITLLPGDDKTCTITNDDQAPKLTLVKTVVNDNGGTLEVSDFPLFIDGIPATSGVSYDQAANVLLTASETNQTGYTASAWGGDCAANGTITLLPGDDKTCTITNDDQTAHLRLVKVVVNDNGGSAIPENWILSAAGPSPISGAGGAQGDVNVGSYALSETSLPGYTAGTWSCVGGTQNGAGVSLGLGESAVCTIINNDQQASITVIKTVVNDNGGTALPNDFNLTLEGGAVLSAVSNPVNPGTYTAGETLLPGYSFTGFSGDCDVNGDTTVALGESKTCTLTNNDIAPILHLRKVVVNDNGGTAVAGDWTLQATGPTSLTGSTPVDSGASFNQGTYSLSESGPTDYTASSWVCVGGTQNGSDITVGLGQEATCTITNNDIAPALHLRKVVVNDNGGTAIVTDFTLTANGAGDNDVIGISPVDSGAGLLAGTFTLSEAGPVGYTASSWSCVGGTQNGGDITLGINQEATCTITNNDIAPTLTLVKTVVNDDGGTLVVSDFPLFIDGIPAVSGTSYDQVANVLLTASEITQTGYAASAWGGDCAANGTVTLLPGDNKTCTITNDDVAPTLTLVKTVVNDNGGTLGVSDFPLFISGTPATSGVAYDQTANVLLTASETTQTGYTPSSWGGDCAANGTVTLQPGDNKTCTITNNDVSPRLTIVKNAEPNDCQDFSFGGGLGSFSLDDSQGVQGCADTDQPQSRIFDNILANNSYTVTETLPNPFWQFAGVACVVTGTTTPVAFTPATNGMSVSLGLGSDVTCTFTNNKTSPTRTIGFWQTHTTYTSSVFAANFAGGMQIGSGIHKGLITNIQAPGQSQLFGGFYAPIAKTTNNIKRTPLDQARIQLLQQLIAAKLNCAAFGCSSTVQGQIAAADAAYAGNSRVAILVSASVLDTYNNSGDTIIIGNAGNATPQVSKSIANLSFWNNP